ncbi:hypothetical protein BO70DRAFT_373857 [Aspergillus heteromorphus CBS 117.55]|uniref:Transcription factor hoxa13 n=1 Tax=Aspergillus heteromorphus CBS 117.55 TaxID=1448321 RepID=A0A317VC00_9EURO|nr:uncharacterized protein BO70DRAFT_373857 [Aspergillus heteromorphus CBS 117.55]PWY70482.1 hypothetical protein BO70DRAFT_373857 [Aspergillus heteromorphus CBS 117.55]
MAVPNNGSVPEAADRPVGASDKKPKPRTRGTIRWTVGLVVRLCIWYALITPFLRCPSQLSDLTDSSPRVCKPYLVARSYVEPHVIPYYNAYGAPYVETARPYVLILNEKVYTPSAHVVKLGYEKYGAPALDRAQSYGQQQWELRVVPHLQAAKDKANGLYQSEVEPHVQRVEAALSPPFQKANGALKSVYRDYLLPFGAKYRPFIGKTYTSGQGMLTTTVLPYAQNSWSSAVYFIHGSLWPRVTGLYWENVEPQLVKIGERLASYREEKRLRNVVEEVDSLSEETSSFLSSPKANEAHDVTSSSTAEVTPPPQPTLSPTEQAAKARESIENDLQIWEEKFAFAAEKGLEDLEERLQQIIDNFMATGTKEQGESLANALKEVVDNEVAGLKQHINNLAESLPSEDSPKAEEAAKDELSRIVKEAAVAIRDRAHSLREWRNSFEEDIMRRIYAAVNATLDVLDSVRDLGLQEVGMRWAWMDGITYKDWARYHALKAQFEDWKDGFRDFGTQHAKLEEARAAVDEVLSRGMDVAETAAKELTRLRDVGRWKIAAREVSDNFDTRSEPPPLLPKPIRETSVDEDSSADETMDTEVSKNETTFASDTAGNAVENEGHDLDGDSETMAADEEQASPIDSSADFTWDEQAPNKATWGAAAANVPDEEVSEKEPRVSSQAEQEAIKNLISELLVGKDSAYAEEIMNQLYSIYGTPRPAPTSSSTLDDATEDALVSDADTPSAPSPIPEDEPSIASHETEETEEIDDARDDADASIAEDSMENDEEQPPITEDSENEAEAITNSLQAEYASLASTASSIASAAAESDPSDSTDAVEDNAGDEL